MNTQKQKQDNSTVCINEDKYNNLWIGTTNGLFCLGPDREKIRIFDTKKGFPIDEILGILIDESNNLWISSGSGIIRYTPNYENIDSMGQIRIFKESDGLNNEEFISNSCLKTKEGAMLFGGKGFNYFYPENIKDNPYVPQIAFTELKVNNNPVLIGDTINNQVVLNKTISETKRIILNNKNNDFSIKFAALHFTIPEKNRYAYILQGYHTQWQYVNSQDRQANFMNLKSGKYTFKVKASNNDGIWNEKPKTIEIITLPPWWQTWWFRISLFVFIIGSALAFYFWRVSSLKQQKRVLEQKVAERTSELRDANSQLEEKQEEILQQNEEIIAVNNQLKGKNEEIETQKEEIEASRDQLKKAFNDIKIISQFGQKITATFNFDSINTMIYDYVVSLMDTNAFGIGIFNEKRNIIDFPYYMENGKPVPYFYKSLNNEKSLTVRCFKNKEEIIINNLSIEYQNYLKNLPEVSSSNMPQSMIHLPLVIEGDCIGTLSVNSLKTNAYGISDTDNLRALASYISIALDNSRAYRLVNRQKEQITGSIQYGKTIQQAMLPSKSLIDKHYENFILFRPKDIVSGDFYWFASVETLHATSLQERNPIHFIAVVDCTGHGVPGAFMSMIGSRLLSEIVSEMHIYEPKTILETLDKLIVKSLRQEETSNNDGMDISLLRIEKDKQDKYHVIYAGAKRPLYYFNGKFHVIDGARRSIGGLRINQSVFPFIQKSLTLQKGDVLYLSTDGFADQCSPERKKFTAKRLVDSLKLLVDSDLSTQYLELCKQLDDFQENYQQRDDITLVGLKL